VEEGLCVNSRLWFCGQYIVGYELSIFLIYLKNNLEARLTQRVGSIWQHFFTNTAFYLFCVHFSFRVSNSIVIFIDSILPDIVIRFLFPKCVYKRLKWTILTTHFTGQCNSFIHNLSPSRYILTLIHIFITIPHDSSPLDKIVDPKKPYNTRKLEEGENSEKSSRKGFQ